MVREDSEDGKHSVVGRPRWEVDSGGKMHAKLETKVEKATVLKRYNSGECVDENAVLQLNKDETGRARYSDSRHDVMHGKNKVRVDE
ncbi:MAG TPA: hypothetical protein DCR55_04095 [Lentisphaeria bacterium]|nr:hypothetical protein [Lentisphaeria bacterium]